MDHIRRRADHIEALPLKHLPVFVVPFLAPHECQILRASASVNMRPATVGIGLDSTPRVSDTRRCHVAVLGSDTLQDRILNHARQVMRSCSSPGNVEFVGHDPIVIIRYEVGDLFKWHVDRGAPDSVAGDRVLGFSIQVSSPDEYTGGDLEFRPSCDVEALAIIRNCGSMILFSAEREHQVTPVLSGTRFSIVGWLHGT